MGRRRSAVARTAMARSATHIRQHPTEEDVCADALVVVADRLLLLLVRKRRRDDHRARLEVVERLVVDGVCGPSIGSATASVRISQSCQAHQCRSGPQGGPCRPRSGRLCG